MPKEKKTVESGAQAKESVSIVPSGAKTVFPYDAMVTALKAGKVYVMPADTKKTSIPRVKAKLKKTLPNVQLGKVKDTEQYVFYL